MIKVEDIDIWGWRHAIRGMRNAFESWDKSDSKFSSDEIIFGHNDLDLMKRLYDASLVGDNHAHRKYLRQIFVSMDVTAPLYLWKEVDTYKVGVTSNSCSTMHTLHKRDLILDDFSHEHLIEFNLIELKHYIEVFNANRAAYIESKNKADWWQMIQMLPSSFNQKRTLTMNYENVITIINQRTDHKLDEWREFVEILKGLPCIEFLMTPKQSSHETVEISIRSNQQ